MSKHTFSKDVILKGRDSYKILFETGLFKNGEFLNIIYMKSESFKIGFAVSRKIKGSVRRNRLKRQLREIYRTNKEYFPADTNLILLAKKENVLYADLKEDVLSLLNEL